MLSDRITINTNPEQNPQMKEIFDILLLAGYFRIRIPSIETFDKLLGGIVWCIANSNFDIDITFEDDMNIKKQIKIAEKICDALKKMNCPFNLTPFQIQGMDFTNIYPVVTWLIQFVYETRQLRQDFNKAMSNFVGRKVYKIFEEQNAVDQQTINETIDTVTSGATDQRNTKNAKIMKISKRDPLRAYSALIQYGDVTAYKTYNRLTALISGQVNLQTDPSLKKKGGAGDSNATVSYQGKQVGSNLNQGKILNSVSNNKLKTDQSQGGESGQIDVAAFLFHSGSSSVVSRQSTGGKPGTGGSQSSTSSGVSQGGKQEEVYVEDDNILIDEIELNDEEKGAFRRLQRRNSVIMNTIKNLVNENTNKIEESLKAADQVEEGQEAFDISTIIKNEREFHAGQIQQLEKRIIASEARMEELSNELYALKEADDQLTTDLADYSKLNNELGDACNQYETEIKQQTKMQSQKVLDEANRYVEQKGELQSKKDSIRKEIKEKMKDLNKEREQAERDMPKVDEAMLSELQSDIAIKQQRYDKKFKEFASLNQEIAVLQRKLENYPSATEVAQYHTRFLELFENIHAETERYKDYYNKFNNLQDIKKLHVDFEDTMRTFKENYIANRQDKKGKEEFVNDLRENYKIFEQNLSQTNDLLKKAKDQKDRTQDNYNNLLSIERQYLKLIKEMRNEFEQNDYYNSQLNQ